MEKLLTKMHEAEHSKYGREKFEKARDAVIGLGDALNGGSKDTIILGIVAGMLATHRYLGNEVVIALLTAMGDFGKLPEAAVSDARNQFAYKLCGRVREGLKDELFWRDP